MTRTLQAIGYLGALLVAFGAGRANAPAPIVGVFFALAAVIAAVSFSLGRMDRPQPRRNHP